MWKSLKDWKQMTTVWIDSKFMDINVEKYEDVPWFKVNGWRQQMKQYKLILQNAYGVKSEDFELNNEQMGRIRVLQIQQNQLVAQMQQLMQG